MVDVRLPVWVGSVMESSASRVAVSQGLPGALVKIQILSICIDASSQAVLMLWVQGPSFSDGSKTVHKWVLRGQGSEWVWRWDGTLHCEYISSVEIPGQDVHTGPSDT